MFDTIKFYQDFIDKNLRDIHTCLLGKVKSIDMNEMKVTVKPMTPYRKHKGDVELPTLFEIPISSVVTNSFIITVPYEVDDIVVMNISEREIDTIVTEGDFSETTDNRIFSLNDAIVIGGLNPFNKPTGLNDTDLQITKRDGTAKIVLKNNGDIIIDSDNIKLGENATEGVALGETLNAWLTSHTHNYTWEDTGGSGTTSAPNESAPPNSNKVKVE